MKEVTELAPVTKKLERAIREGKVSRYHGKDWIGDASDNNIISHNEAERLRRLEELTAKVIAVDQFEPGSIKGVTEAAQPTQFPAE